MKRWVGILLVFLEVAAVAAFSAACAPKAPVPAELFVTGMETRFALGDEFTTGELSVSLRYDDNSVERLSPESYTVDSTAYRSDEAGSYEIQVRHTASALTASYTVTVEGGELEGKYLTAEGGKELFYLGEEFSSEGLRVTLHGAAEGEEREVTSGEYTVDSAAFDSQKEGDYPIVVKMSGLTAHYTVKVRTDYTESFKVLAVGNSFSDDATEYLYDIAKSYGVKDVRIGNLYVGGCSLSQHRGFAENNQAAYAYRKNTTGVTNTTENYRLSDALQDEDWDVVVLQQASHDSGKSATYNNDLEYLIEYVSEHRTVKDGKLAWHMTWAYQQDSTHWAFPNYGSNQLVMYESIVNAVSENIVSDSRFDAVFPSGTAIQNARTSYLGDRLTRDGYHLTLDTGRYIAALTWYLTLTGKDVNDLSYATLPSTSVADVDVIKESVENAIKYPFSVSQSSYSEEREFDLSQYDRLNWAASAGYWFSTNAERYAEVIADAPNSPLFAASPRFTREQLPVGTLLVLKDGWRYRPEAWSAEDGPEARRPDNVLAKYIVVDEAWWEGYLYRAFNLSRATGENISQRLEEAQDALQIYIPKKAANK